MFLSNNLSCVLIYDVYLVQNNFKETSNIKWKRVVFRVGGIKPRYYFSRYEDTLFFKVLFSFPISSTISGVRRKYVA